MKNLKMGVKMLLGFGGVILILAVVAGIFAKALDDTHTKYADMSDVQTAIAFKAGEITETMLQARRNEKDFLMRKDMKYLERNKEVTDQISALANEVAAIAEAANLTVEVAEVAEVAEVEPSAEDGSADEQSEEEVTSTEEPEAAKVDIQSLALEIADLSTQ